MIVGKLTDYPIEALLESVCQFGGLIYGKYKVWVDPKDYEVIDYSRAMKSFTVNGVATQVSFRELVNM